MTVSIPKTKVMAMGDNLSGEDVTPVKVNGGQIEVVEHFTYLGWILSNSGDVKSRIVKASRVFGMLRNAVFSNP